MKNILVTICYLFLNTTLHALIFTKRSWALSYSSGLLLEIALIVLGLFALRNLFSIYGKFTGTRQRVPLVSLITINCLFLGCNLFIAVAILVASALG